MESIRNQSEGIEIMATDSNGNRQSVAHAGYTIRAGKSLGINIDVFNAELMAENATDAKASINAFVDEAIAAAAATGIPIGE